MNASDIQRAMDILCQRLHHNQSSGFHISPHLEKAAWHDTVKWGVPVLCHIQQAVHEHGIEKKLPNVRFQLVDGYMLKGKLWLRYCEAKHFDQARIDKRFTIPHYFCTAATSLLLAADHNLESLVTSAIGDLNLLSSTPDLILKLLELGVPIDDQENQSVMTYEPSLLENPDYAHYGCW
jgi:hypothetical protein